MTRSVLRIGAALSAILLFCSGGLPFIHHHESHEDESECPICIVCFLAGKVFIISCPVSILLFFLAAVVLSDEEWPLKYLTVFSELSRGPPLIIA